MNETIELITIDKHNFDAFILRPDTKPKGGLVVIQEIFGVNKHIREVCKKFMKEGYLTIAPSLFDRENKNIELDYKKDDIDKGRFLKEKYNLLSLNEINSSIDYVRSAGKVGVVGYCWGGSLAYRSGCHLKNINCSVAYYGGDIPKSNLVTKCPSMCHFGELDAGIPIDEVLKFKNDNPEIKVFTYPADHGFNCDHRSQYNEVCSRIAYQRTVEFLNKNLI